MTGLSNSLQATHPNPAETSPIHIDALAIPTLWLATPLVTVGGLSLEACSSVDLAAPLLSGAPSLATAPFTAPGARRRPSQAPIPVTPPAKLKALYEEDSTGALLPLEASALATQDTTRVYHLDTDSPSPQSSLLNPDHTILTLAQRRRSSARQTQSSTDVRRPSTSIFTRYLPNFMMKSPSSRDREKTKSRWPWVAQLGASTTAMLPGVLGDGPPRQGSFRRFSDNTPRRRQSTALALLDGTDGSAMTMSRKLRKAVLQLSVVAVVAVLVANWMFPAIVPSFDIEAFPGLSSLTNVRVGREDGPPPKESASASATLAAVAVPSPAAKVKTEAERFREKELWGATELQSKTQVTTQKGGSSHEATVIYLHGLSQSAWDGPLASYLGSRLPTIRPDMEISVRNNESRPAWFDMHAFPYVNAKDEDPIHLYSSARLINSIIVAERSVLILNLRSRGGISSLPERERPVTKAGLFEVHDGEIGTPAEREWASSRIVLAGFSQGGVMALLTGLTARDRLAGVVVLSGYMPLRKTFKSLIEGLGRTSVPVFWGHGQADPYLLHGDAVESVSLLQSATPNTDNLGGLGLTGVEFHSYPSLQHTYFPVELTEVGNFLERILPSRRGYQD
ncbi:hypothetical protein P7C70_g317, partial [Phenoliferia sp. Uapishka_3]